MTPDLLAEEEEDETDELVDIDLNEFLCEFPGTGEFFPIRLLLGGKSGFHPSPNRD